ncbi:MAG: complex I subunit 5 family protein [Sulfolobales archaeon]
MILLSSILIPALMTLIIALTPRLSGRFGSIASFTAILYSLLIYVLTPVVYGIPYFEKIFGSASIGVFGFFIDSYNIPFLLGISLVSSIVSLYSYPYMEHRFRELGYGSWRVYYVNYLLFALSMNGVALSNNLIEFYVFLEISLITSFILVALYGYGARIRIGIMYFIWTHVGALLFLLGSLIYGINAGTFDFISPEKPYYMIGYGEKILGVLGMQFSVFLLILIGLMVKLPALGFHIWLPYAHAEAPTPVSALLSPNLIGLAGLGLVRVLVTLFPHIFCTFQYYLILWALLTMIYGGLVALFQNDYKRFLAYSSISQMGYILLGVSTLTPAGLIGAVLHYLTHALGKATLFMTAGGIIFSGHGLRDMRKMGGLASTMNYTASSALLGFLTISGLPPTMGVISKFFIVSGFIIYLMSQVGNVSEVVALAILGFLGFGLTIVYSFVTMRRIFFGQRRSDEEIRETSPEISLTTFSVALLSILMLVLISFLLSSFNYTPELLYLKIILSLVRGW